ncbi:TerC family protein [Roseivivax sp. CAU 1761]
MELEALPCHLSWKNEVISMDYLAALATDPTAWAALLTLITMEVVLGIDNLIFISILTNKLPENQRERARRIGIAGAMLLRLGLLGLVAVIVQLTQPVFTAFGHGFSWRDLILIAGGLFLVWKATKEIHHHVDPDHAPDMFEGKAAIASVGAVIGQILLLDLVFSIDSIITAVGMTDDIPIMVVAVLVTVAAMLIAANPLANFIQANPTVVMLALGFLLLIGTTLIAEGFGAHVPKGYIYAAMAFSALVEGLNLMARRAARRRRQSLRSALALKTGATPAEYPSRATGATSSRMPSAAN